MFNNVYETSMEMIPSPIERDIHHPDMNMITSVAGSTVFLPSDGFPTPPQSARESHCGSLIYSCFSDTPPSGPSSVGNFSISTPDIMAGHFNDVFTRKGVHQKNHGNSRDELHIQNHQSHAQDKMLRQGVDSNLCDANIDHELPSHNVSAHSDHTNPRIKADNICGERDVWLTARALSTDVCTPRSFYCESDSPIHTILAGPAYLQNPTSRSFESPGYCQSPQVVIPSQSSPTDEWLLHNYPSCTSPNHEDQPYSGSFCSKEDTSPQFGAVDQLGLEEIYIGNPKEGYSPMVKGDAQSSSTSQTFVPSRCPNESGKNLNLRPRRRWPKRRKSNIPRTKVSRDQLESVCERDWGYTWSHGCSKGNAIVPSQPASKRHVCSFQKDGKTCGRRFERNEHLRRHLISHTDERKYHCPLENCEKKISRSDNAGDHFKTHLKEASKGRRNKHTEWPVLRDLLLLKYDEKDATKMILKLERWIWETPEGQIQRHWMDEVKAF